MTAQPPSDRQELLDDVAEASRQIELMRRDMDAAVVRARDAGISFAKIATAAGVSTQAVRNALARSGRLEVSAAQLQRGDRILAHVDEGQTLRHRGWVVKEPLGLHPRAGRPCIQLERRPEDSADHELNLWPFTDYSDDAVFIIERDTEA